MKNEIRELLNKVEEANANYARAKWEAANANSALNKYLDRHALTDEEKKEIEEAKTTWRKNNSVSALMIGF